MVIKIQGQDDAAWVFTDDGSFHVCPAIVVLMIDFVLFIAQVAAVMKTHHVAQVTEIHSGTGGVFVLF